MRTKLAVGIVVFLGAAPIARAQTGPSQHVESVHIDHFGYRPADPKIAVLAIDPGGAVEIRNTGGSPVYQVPGDGGSITDAGTDPASGEHVWRVDFSGWTTPGTGYYLAVPSQSASSVPFDIRDDVYAAPLQLMINSFLLARCGAPKPAPFAGNWVDDACHLADATATAASGMTDYGTLDLSGGYHDAGDLNKYVSVLDADDREFFAELALYDLYPALFPDGALQIPENHNGIELTPGRSSFQGIGLMRCEGSGSWQV